MNYLPCLLLTHVHVHARTKKNFKTLAVIVSLSADMTSKFRDNFALGCVALPPDSLIQFTLLFIYSMFQY